MNEDKKHTILVVDDERANIRALSHLLLSDYTVFMAKDGRTALEMAMNNRPDLILLDIVMPDMSGYDVIAELKSSDFTMDIPVIFITGLDSVADEEKGFLLGAVDYITKPFNKTIVMARIRQHLQALRQFRMIKQLGILDPLTDIPNRRGFNERLDIEWNRAIRDNCPISLLMIDIDKFKNYNDKYGHPQGDVLLQTVARVFCQSISRAVDFAARWGGEEFAIMLPGTDLDGAQKIAEQIRVNVENTKIPCVNGSETTVTVSIGVSMRRPVPGDLPDDFISSADKALYSAKNAGRNKVVLSK